MNLQTIKQIYTLKSLERTGWVKNKIQQPETVASHSFGVGFLAYLYAKQCGVDEHKVMKMGLLHDVQESIVGDITPFCGVSDEKKHDLEMKAAEIFAAQQPEMKELFDEYEANTTQEAKFVHDCDKLDMLIQAWIYEQQQGVKLDQFFEHCDLPKSFDVLIQVRKEIERCRAK